MSKTLEKLFNKAMKTGYANINGRMRAYGYVGEHLSLNLVALRIQNLL